MSCAPLKGKNLLQVRSVYYQGESLLTVIAVLNNDCKILESFAQEVVETLKTHYRYYELILIDNGSKDGTHLKAVELLKNTNCVRYLRLSKYCEWDLAVFSGLDAAIGDAVVVMSPSSAPAHIIPEMAKQALKINGIVFGLKQAVDKHTLLGRFLHKIIQLILAPLLPPDFSERTAEFVALNR